MDHSATSNGFTRRSSSTVKVHRRLFAAGEVRIVNPPPPPALTMDVVAL